MSEAALDTDRSNGEKRILNLVQAMGEEIATLKKELRDAREELKASRSSSGVSEARVQQLIELQIMKFDQEQREKTQSAAARRSVSQRRPSGRITFTAEWSTNRRR